MSNCSGQPCRAGGRATHVVWHEVGRLLWQGGCLACVVPCRHTAEVSTWTNESMTRSAHDRGSRGDEQARDTHPFMVRTGQSGCFPLHHRHAVDGVGFAAVLRVGDGVAKAHLGGVVPEEATVDGRPAVAGAALHGVAAALRTDAQIPGEGVGLCMRRLVVPIWLRRPWASKRAPSVVMR